MKSVYGRVLFSKGSVAIECWCLSIDIIIPPTTSGLHLSLEASWHIKERWALFKVHVRVLFQLEIQFHQVTELVSPCKKPSWICILLFTISLSSAATSWSLPGNKYKHWFLAWKSTLQPRTQLPFLPLVLLSTASKSTMLLLWPTSVDASYWWCLFIQSDVLYAYLCNPWA